MGWSPDMIAAAAQQEGCKADAADCQQLINLTGGLPLFILNAISVAKSDYDGSLKRLCADIARSAHTKEVAQDFILGQVFDRLPKEVSDVAELLSLCDVPLTRDEIRSYVSVAGGPDPAVLDRSLRNLVRQGLLQIFANDRIKLHDAARTVGKGRLILSGTKILQSHTDALRAVVQRSLMESWHSSKLSLFLRLTGEAGRLDVIVEIATDELFHEMGIWPEIESYLVHGAQDETINPDQRIKALDGLAFYDLKTGSDRATHWLDQMDTLITEHNLGAEERLRVDMKRINLLAMQGDKSRAALLITDLTPIVRTLSNGHQRVFEYNVACAELALGDAIAASNRIKPLIESYYELIGLSFDKMMGNNAPALSKMLRKDANIDDIKHLADALDVFAKIQDAQGTPSFFARIHALKLYDLVHAPDSLFRVGQDLVDQFILMHDFDGALHIMETIILPQLQQWKLVDYMIIVRSQYAVVLAYCKRFLDAEAEMARLAPYTDALSPLIQGELSSQQKLIANLKKNGPPPKWEPQPGLLESIARSLKEKQIAKPSLRPFRRKIGRNDRCPCGSGKKFKHCHGNGN